jgi:hypothetical protein
MNLQCVKSRKRGCQAGKLDVKLAKIAEQQMHAQRLEVCLVNAPDQKFNGHKIRVVSERNPEWYRILVRRRPRTHSIRQYVLKALRRVQSGYIGPHPWCMDLEIVEVLREYEEELFDFSGRL